MANKRQLQSELLMIYMDENTELRKELEELQRQVYKLEQEVERLGDENARLEV